MNKSVPIYFLILIAAIPSFSLDIYLPSMLEIQHELLLSERMLQMTLTVFVVTFAFIQLLFGPLSDRYGRKNILLIGLSFFLVGSFIAVFSSNITQLLIARACQGIGACAGVLSAFSIARDCFEAEERPIVLSKIAMYVGIAPIIAPVIGGILKDYFGWRSIFMLLGLLSVFLLILTVTLLQETLSKEHQNTQVQALQSYKMISIHPIFTYYTGVATLAFAGLFCFITTSPILLIDQLGLSAKLFGFMFALNAFSFLLGAKYSAFLNQKTTPDQCILLGLCLMLTGGIIMFALMQFIGLNLLGLLIPMMIATFGIAIIIPNCTSLMLEPFANKAGSTTALNTFIRFIAAGVVSMIVGYLNINNQLFLSVFLSFAALSGLLLVMVRFNMIQKQREQSS